MGRSAKKVSAFLFILEFLAFPVLALPRDVDFQKITVDRLTVDVVTANLQSGQISFDLVVAGGGNHPGHSLFPHDTFANLVSKTRPAAAIDGTYYDTRTFVPVGTLASDGRLLLTGSHGVGVCIDKKNRVEFLRTQDVKNFDWGKYKVVISTGPTLIENGEIHLYPAEEQFHDPEIFKPARRSALGVTADNKLLLVGVRTPIGLRRLAWVMQKLGAVHAVSLDGGSSTALYYRGEYIIHPSRLLTNILEVREPEGPPAALPAKPAAVKSSASVSPAAPAFTKDSLPAKSADLKPSAAVSPSKPIAAVAKDSASQQKKEASLSKPQFSLPR